MNREGYTLYMIVVVAAPEEFVIVDESFTVACPSDFLQTYDGDVEAREFGS